MAKPIAPTPTLRGKEAVVLKRNEKTKHQKRK